MVKTDYAALVNKTKEKGTLKESGQNDTPTDNTVVNQDVPKVSEKDFEGIESFDKLSTEEKAKVLDETNQKQEDETSKGKPMEKDKLLNSGMRRAINIQNQKNKELESKLEEERKKNEELQSKLQTPNLPENFDEVTALAEEYKTLKENGLVDPKTAVEIINAMKSGGSLFREQMRQSLGEEVYKDLFIVEQQNTELTLEDAKELALAGMFVEPRESFESDEAFLEAANKTKKSVDKFFPRQNMEEMKRQLSEELYQKIAGSFAPVSQDLQELKERIKSLGNPMQKSESDIPEEALGRGEEATPATETVVDEAPKLSKEQQEIQAFADHSRMFNNLSNEDVEIISKLIKEDDIYKEAFSEDKIDVEQAKKGITLTIKKYLEAKRNAKPLSEPTTETPTPTRESKLRNLNSRKTGDSSGDKWLSIRDSVKPKDKGQPLI